MPVFQWMDRENTGRMKKINQRLFKRLILYYNVGEGNFA